MSNDTINSDVLSRMRSYDPPPIGFDPRTASEELLRRHGLPRRPDPNREPDLAKMWELAFSRPLTFIKAELAINAAIKRSDSQRRRSAVFGPTGWAGAVRQQRPYHDSFDGDPRIISVLGQPKSDYSQPATAAFTQFQVPQVRPPQVPQDDTTRVGFWVGLDGYGDDGPLQAGIQAIVSGKNVTYSAWFEWVTAAIPDTAQGATVVNLPVGPRDAVFVAVSTVRPDCGLASIVNIETGYATTVGIQAPPNVKSLGATAEWIVEVPVTEPPSRYLPYFTPVIFTGCTGESSNELFHVGPDALVVNMIDTQTDFQPITQTYVEASVVIVEWLADGSGLSSRLGG